MKSTDGVDAHERVMRLTQRLVTEANKVSSAFVTRHRMHATDVNALIRILVGQQHGEPTTAGWLGEELGLTSGAVTAVVDRLERAGLLRRVRDPHDRRRVMLENSSDGQRLAEEYFAPVRRRSEAVMVRFTARELGVIARYLDATAAAMAEHREFLMAEHHPGSSAEE